MSLCYKTSVGVIAGCKESIKSDLVPQDLAPVGKAAIQKVSRTKYGIDGASWSFNNT